MAQLVNLVDVKNGELIHKTCRFEVLAFYTKAEFDSCQSERDFKKRIRAITMR